MQKIILIGGDMAAGKSTYSRFLQEKFNLTLINKDSLKELFGDLIETHNREENKFLSVLSFAVIKYFVKNSRCNLIIESNFKDYEIKELKELVKDKKVLSVKLTGDTHELHERFLKRLNENRHPVHHNEEFYSYEGFKASALVLRKVELLGEVYNFDVSKENYPQNDENLTKKIKEFLES